MIKFFFRTLALIIAISPATSAFAQQLPFTLPQNTVIGRTSIGPGEATAIPFADLAVAIGVSPAGTSGQIQTNNGAGGLGAIAAPSGAIVGTTDVQTLTNKSISAAEVNSGTLPILQMPGLTGDCSSSAGTVTTTCRPAIGAVTGLGTGIAAALGANIGSAGAPVTNGGAGGTPSSITLTHGTGLPTTGLTGTLQAAQEPAHTGDVTNTAGSLALSVVKIGGVTPGPAATALAGQLPGTATNDNASTGNIGEYFESVILPAAQVALTTSSAANVTSLSLTAGDWDCSGAVSFSGAGGTVTTDMIGWISTTSAILPADSVNHGAYTRMFAASGLSYTQEVVQLPVNALRVSVSTTTTVFLSARSTFTTAGNFAYGAMRCRRMR